MVMLRECIVSASGTTCLARQVIGDHVLFYCILRFCEQIACDVWCKRSELRWASDLESISFT